MGEQGKSIDHWLTHTCA